MLHLFNIIYFILHFILCVAFLSYSFLCLLYFIVFFQYSNFFSMILQHKPALFYTPAKSCYMLSLKYVIILYYTLFWMVHLQIYSCHLFFKFIYP